ncbi:MAG: DinB family protein [Anaerolineales bacterium]
MGVLYLFIMESRYSFVGHGIEEYVKKKEAIADSISQSVGNFCDRHRQLTEEVTIRKPSESGWTIKEIVGHLIDSAANNHQRITRLQLVAELQFPPYENEKWLAAEKWNFLGWFEILGLFQSYNLFLVHLIRNVDPGNLNHRWFGRDRFGERIYTLEEIIVDYRTHLQEHLDQIETQLKEFRGDD